MKKRKKSFFARVQESDTLLNELLRIPKITIADINRIGNYPGVTHERGLFNISTGVLEKGEERVFFEITDSGVRIISDEEGCRLSRETRRFTGKIRQDGSPRASAGG